MMAADEALSLAALNLFREAHFHPIVAGHAGRVFKLTGDGALVEFASVVDAVDCARELQTATANFASSTIPIVLRIGINLGDVILQGDDIYGDGVNVAARLEQLATPGGVCVSAAVAEIVRGRIDIPFEDGGEVRLKNIDRPLRVFHWFPGSPGKDLRPDVASKQVHRLGPSIAVLPFDNMSDDPEQTYFSDGISEDIITDLSKVSGLTVIARNSSFAYRGNAIDLRQLGRELGVNCVLEGSVRRSGQRVRITAQLIDAQTGAHIWADRFDRDLTDLFLVQDEVTLEIVKSLKVHLTPKERAGIADIGTTNMAAHELFMRMRARHFFPGLTGEMWKQAVADGEKAVELDPDYAQAHAVLSFMHVLDFHNHWSGRGEADALALCKEHSEHSFALAPEGVLSNQAVAVAAFWNGDLDLAEQRIKKVLDLSPDYALGLFTYGEIEMGRRRFDNAVAAFERSIRLDPAFRHQYLQFLGMAHFLMRRFEAAALMFRERLNLVPNTDVGRAWLSATLGHLGEVDEAHQLWEELAQIAPSFNLVARLARLPFVAPQDIANVMDGLRKAGLQAPHQGDANELPT